MGVLDRARRALTTRELSELAGVGIRAAQIWVSGRGRPSPGARRLLAKLGIKEVGNGNAPKRPRRRR
jgi:hypothetical protein